MGASRERLALGAVRRSRVHSAGRATLKVYHNKEAEREFFSREPRAHPWTIEEHDASHRYVDFCQDPELIPTSLEDFQDWQDQPGTQSFFEFLRHVNRPGRFIETNDCAFDGVNPNEQQDAPFEGEQPALRGSGRVMFLFREPQANIETRFSEAMFASLIQTISVFECESKAVIGLSFFPTRFTRVPGEPHGQQVVAGWWSTRCSPTPNSTQHRSLASSSRA